MARIARVVITDLAHHVSSGGPVRGKGRTNDAAAALRKFGERGERPPGFPRERSRLYILQSRVPRANDQPGRRSPWSIGDTFLTLSATGQYKVSLGRTATTLDYEDATGIVTFAFDITPAEKQSARNWTLHLDGRALG